MLIWLVLISTTVGGSGCQKGYDDKSIFVLADHKLLKAVSCLHGPDPNPQFVHAVESFPFVSFCVFISCVFTCCVFFTDDLSTCRFPQSGEYERDSKF